MTYFAHFRHYRNGPPENASDFRDTDIVATIAVIREKNSNDFLLGFAFVSIEDQASKKIGRSIAENRALSGGSHSHSYRLPSSAAQNEVATAIEDVVSTHVSRGWETPRIYVHEIVEKAAVIAHDVFNKNHAVL